MHSACGLHIKGTAQQADNANTKATEDRASVSHIVVSCACAATHKKNYILKDFFHDLIFF
jgi:hypothetical protein